METQPCPYCGDLYDICVLPEHADACARAFRQVALPSFPLFSNGSKCPNKKASMPPPPVKPATVTCAMCKGDSLLDDLFILDECSCKFHRKCIAAHVTQAITQSSNITCPMCTKGISMRDAKEVISHHCCVVFVCMFACVCVCVSSHRLSDA